MNMKEWFKEKKDLIKLFFMSLFKQIGYVVLMFLVWMSMEDLILPILHRVTDSTISKLHVDWVVYLTLLAAFILFIYFGIKIIKKYQVSKWFLSNLILISLIYTRYRFYSNEFVFWSWNNRYYLDLLYVLSGIVLLCSLVIFIISLIKIESKNTINSHLLRDDELEDPTDDCLGYNEQVVSLSNLLETVDVSRRAYSVGIVGEWGIGKSSMLKLFAKCKSDKNNIIVQYNPRHAKNTQLIQEDFFNQLRAKLSYYNGNIGLRINKYAYALQLTTPTKWFYAIWDLFANWTVDAEKQRINEVLRSLNRKIYIIIEDLDRLTGEEILEVLKLIDANGNFSNTFFLTAYDKNYVNGVLKRTLKLDDDSADYTDKYFNYECIIVKPRKNQLQKILKKEVLDWAKKVAPEDVTIKDDNILYSISDCLVKNLPTIRQIKRFANNIRGSYLKAKDNVIFCDYALMMLIKFIDQEAYWDIYRLKFITNRGNTSTLPYYSLISDYKSLTKGYNKFNDLNSILNLLFNPNRINKIQYINQVCRVEAFENYFYERIEGKLYPIDIDKLLSLDMTCDDALNKLSKYLDKPNNINSIEEYFSWEIHQRLDSKEQLMRYMCLLIYSALKINNLFISLRLNNILLRNTCKEYLVTLAISEKDYLDTIISAFNIIVNYIPYHVGVFAIQRINTRKGNNIDNELCDKLEDNVKIALAAQNKYDSKYGSSDWNALSSLALSDIKTKKARSKKAKKQLKGMMYNYPTVYATKLIHLDDRKNLSGEKCTIVEITSYSMLKAILGNDLSIWINSIEQQDINYILSTLYGRSVDKEYANLLIPYIDKEYYTDYALIARFVEKRLSEIKEKV